MAHLSAAFSALLGVKVVSPAKAVARGQHDLVVYSTHQLFRATHIPVCADYHIVIQRLTGENFTISVAEGHTTAHVKAAIHAKEGIHPGEQWLLHKGETLEDWHILQECGVCTNSVIMYCQLQTPCVLVPDGDSQDTPNSCGTATGIPMIKLHDPEEI